MKKLLSVLGAIGLIATSGEAVISCGNNTPATEGNDNKDLAKLFHERVSSLLVTNYNSKKQNLISALNPEKESGDFKYLRGKIKELAKTKKDNSSPEQGIDVSGEIDGESIISDITSNNIVINESDLKNSINELVESTDFSALSTNGGQVYNGISVDGNSGILKFKESIDKNGETDYDYISLALKINLEWLYDSNGSQTDSTSIPILFQLINDKVVIEAVKNISYNFGRQAFVDGDTRFISTVGEKDADKFNKLTSEEKSSGKSNTKALEDYYTKNNLNAALSDYVMNDTLFKEKLKTSLGKIDLNQELGDVTLNSDSITFDDKNWLSIEDEKSVDSIEQNYDSEFWGLFAGQDQSNVNDGYKIIDNVIANKSNASNNDVFKNNFDKWISEKVKLNKDEEVSEQTALTYGSLAVTGLSVKITNTNYDLGTIFFDFDYSNNNETLDNGSGALINGRDLYFDKLINKYSQAFRKALGVTETGSKIDYKDEQFLSVSKDSESAKYAVSHFPSGQLSCDFLRDSDASKVSGDLGLDASQIKMKIINKSWWIESTKNSDHNYIYEQKNRNAGTEIKLEIVIGSINITIKLYDFVYNKNGIVKLIDFK